VPIRLRVSFLAAALLAMAFGIFAMLHRNSAWPLLLRQLAPLSAQPAVTSTLLSVGPGEGARVAGQPFVVVARADQLGDALPVLIYQLGDSPVNTAAMPMVEGGYAFEFAALDQPLRYRVRAGDAISQWFTVQILNSAGPAAPSSTLPQATTSPDNADQAAIDAYRQIIHPATQP
jgi:hypothetical protein